MPKITRDARRKALALKTIDCIQPSVGDYKEFAKRIRYLYNLELQRYKKAALKAARQYLKGVKDTAQIDDITLLLAIAIERQYPKSAQLGYELVSKNLDEVKSHLMAMDAPDPPYTFNKLYAEAMARYRIKATQEKARDISYWFCRKLLRNVNHRMRRNLAAAGISAQWLQKRWSVPVIKGQYLSPAAAKGLPQYEKAMVELITKMSAQSHKKVLEAIAKGLRKGHNIKELTETLGKLENMDPARAERVARDQSCKLNQFIQRENMKAIGITQGQWIHVPGMYTYRDSHKFLLDGQVYDLNKGIYDPEVKRDIQPGELPYCRCVFRSVIPDSLLTG